MQKKKIVIANLKMFPQTLREAIGYLRDIKRMASRLRNTETVVCPPFPYFGGLPKVRSTAFFLGAQNVAHERVGPHTGEVSAHMLKNIGVRFALVGHSERRALGESNALIQGKIRAGLAEKLSVVLCIGEQTRDAQGAYLSFLREQLSSALIGLSPAELRYLSIAYEPIWAIGKTTKDAMAEGDLHEITIFIRKTLTELFGRRGAEAVRILYGGSVEASNAASLMEGGAVQGFLVGHASHDPKTFSEILTAVDRAR